jgi:hypothetical protein
MAGTATKKLLSGSTNGKPVVVAATTIASGTTIHTCNASTGDDMDLITLFAMNIDTVSRKLIIGWGGTADAELIEVTIPAESGLVPVAVALPLQNSLIVKAACATANVINLFGYVIRLDQ